MYGVSVLTFGRIYATAKSDAQKAPRKLKEREIRRSENAKRPENAEKVKKHWKIGSCEDQKREANVD